MLTIYTSRKAQVLTKNADGDLELVPGGPNTIALAKGVMGTQEELASLQADQVGTVLSTSGKTDASQ